MATWLCLVLGLVSLSFVQCNYCTVQKYCFRSGYKPCKLWGWSRCYWSEYYDCSYQACCSGWTGSGCRTPKCNPGCFNGGICTAPDTCRCPSAYSGQFCTTLLCSRKQPCFPGTCSYPSNCACSHGFSDPSSGCLSFSGENNVPVINECELTLANIRRTDKKQLFYYNGPCTNETIWCNQELFNYAKFNMSSHYPPLEYLPPPPSYVKDHGLGVVYSGMRVVHTKHPRQGGNRFVALDKTYTCSGFSRDYPKRSFADCNIVEENYIINIEDNDEFAVTYITRSGGFRKMRDPEDYQTKTEYYSGQESTKSVTFKFDFIAPVHCSEGTGSTPCRNAEVPIRLQEDITRLPINITWDGWSDELSGIDLYYVEVFRLQPNIHDELIELEPLKPIQTFVLKPTPPINYPTFYANDTGMYSILLQVSDRSNNSKIARRLVLFDKNSEITLTKPGFLSGKPMNLSAIKVSDGGMHVTSAIPETGYMWQTSRNGSKTRIVVDWQKHFVNKDIADKKLLNKVLPYPTQFADLEDDGVLRSKKYVSIDDHEGARTLNAIPNKYGIVMFEWRRVYTDDRSEPTDGWQQLGSLDERYEFEELLDDGSHVRIWIRATDIVNNTKADYTEVHIDDSPPRISENFNWIQNIENGTYTHTSRIKFVASDDGSGVHMIEYVLFVGNNTEEHNKARIPANKDNTTNACTINPNCNCILHTCFLKDQTVDIDNCMFLVPKQELNQTGRILVKVYNQALLFQQFHVNISRLSSLSGLEKYSGPTNIRVEKNLATGVRLTWDLPETISCYGQADIIVVLVDTAGVVRAQVYLQAEQTSVDLVGLDPEAEYSVALKLGYKGTELLQADPYSFKTAAQANYLSGGAVAGIVIGVLVIIGLMLVVFAVMLRRGYMAPVRRGLSAMSVKYRKSMAGWRGRRTLNDYGDSQQNRDSLYMYGEMDFKDIQSWQFSRDDVVLESLLKSGSFANVYLARLRTTNAPTVAKTLKEGYSKDDELLMKAKINFSAMEVGNHVNVLKFIGAVCSDTEFGPFIIYEYCSNGPLKDYLESIRSSITLETIELLLRIGLGVARGMEYLAGRKIVHRRLAARNILLDESLEVKITGFGPQPDQTKDGDAKAQKRERIPLKWMAPECLKSTSGATEKSDVWSFGVVLWEIFSLGGSPYESIPGRKLPEQLKSGYRLPKPEQCDDKWYSVMQRTWQEDPAKRPTFKEIRVELDEVFVAAPKDDYYYYRK